MAGPLENSTAVKAATRSNHSKIPPASSANNASHVLPAFVKPSSVADATTEPHAAATPTALNAPPQVLFKCTKSATALAKEVANLKTNLANAREQVTKISAELVLVKQENQELHTLQTELQGAAQTYLAAHEQTVEYAKKFEEEKTAFKKEKFTLGEEKKTVEEEKKKLTIQIGELEDEKEDFKDEKQELAAQKKQFEEHDVATLKLQQQAYTAKLNKLAKEKAVIAEEKEKYEVAEKNYTDAVEKYMAANQKVIKEQQRLKDRNEALQVELAEYDKNSKILEYHQIALKQEAKAVAEDKQVITTLKERYHKKVKEMNAASATVEAEKAALRDEKRAVEEQNAAIKDVNEVKKHAEQKPKTESSKLWFGEEDWELVDLDDPE